MVRPITDSRMSPIKRDREYSCPKLRRQSPPFSGSSYSPKQSKLHRYCMGQRASFPIFRTRVLRAVYSLDYRHSLEPQPDCVGRLHQKLDRVDHGKSGTILKPEHHQWVHCDIPIFFANLIGSGYYARHVYHASCIYKLSRGQNGHQGYGASATNRWSLGAPRVRPFCGSVAVAGPSGGWAARPEGDPDGTPHGTNAWSWSYKNWVQRLSKWAKSFRRAPTFYLRSYAMNSRSFKIR